MKRFARLLVVTLGFGVLGFVISLVPQKSATGSGSAPVSIIGPLPIPVTGTVNASVGGTVNAAQSGTWNVGITGTPTVNANVTFPSSLPVNDGNAFNPYRTNCSESGGVSSKSGFCDLGVVPDGKELVIEEVTGHIPGAPPGTVPLILSRLYIEVGTQTYDVGTFLTGNDVGISERVRLYADPGTHIVLGIIGNCPCQSTFSLSGYTVNLAQ